MRSSSVYKIAVTSVGCVLGAGFLSGQELLSFFGVYGAWGFVGIGVSMLFFAITAATILSLAHDTGFSTAEDMVVFFDSRVARGAVTAFEELFLFFVDVLMVAAAGALAADTFGIPPVWGSAVFSLLTLLVSLLGFGGLVRVFSFIVPVLVVATLAVACGGLSTLGTATPTVTGEGNFFTSALVYVVFNLICSIPILSPVGRSATSKKAIVGGVLIASLSLAAIATLIILALDAAPAACNTELPMLTFAGQFGGGIRFLYALLLFGGIFGTSLSSKTAINAFLRSKMPSRPLYFSLALVLAAVAFGIALSGFRSLVGVLYPICGYIGILPLLLLFVHAFLFYRGKKRN